MIRRFLILAGILLGTAFGIAAPGAARTDGLVDVNRASVTELMKVPGMTRVWAQRIVRFRPYQTKLDLKEKGVVTAEVYLRIKDGVVAHRLNK